MLRMRPLTESGESTSTIGVEHDSTRIAAEWDELADRTRAVPFVRPGWIAAWWAGFGDGDLRIVTLRRGGRLAGVLPYYTDGGWTRSPTNDQTPQFGVLAEDAAATRELAAALVDRAGDRLMITYLDASSVDASVLRASAEARGYRVIARPTARAPYLELDRDWQTLEARLARPFDHERSGSSSAASISALRRRRRQLEKQGRLTLEVGGGVETLDDLLEEGFRIETSGWKAAQETAIVSDSKTRRFYTDVARWAATRGSLRLAFLRLDGTPLAFQFALELDGVYYMLKSGYEPAWRRYSPGNLLVHEMLRHASSTGVGRYEFLGDAEPWKLEWTRTVHVRVALEAFAPSLPGLAAWAARLGGRPILRLARKLRQ
jgi:CelD/BcsL family acetyltransferase involved in cellulose biosynthesis